MTWPQTWPEQSLMCPKLQNHWFKYNRVNNNFLMDFFLPEAF